MNDEINFTAVPLPALVYDDDDDDDDDDDVEKEEKEEEEVDANSHICRVPYVKLGPNSITLSRSQTRFPIRFPRSCGSATSWQPDRNFIGSKAGRRQVPAISTSSVRVDVRPGLSLKSVMEFGLYCQSC